MGFVAVLLTSTMAALTLTLAVTATPLRFDQRQNGSVNVQVDLKDLEVYAIMEDEQLEGAMVHAIQAADSLKQRPGAPAALDAYESLKGSSGASPGAVGLVGALGAAPTPAAGTPAAPAAPSSNAPRRPNDKLASIKNKPQPHERSEVAPDALLWESAAARGEESVDEELEPRATTSVEARAAPAPPSASDPGPGPGPVHDVPSAASRPSQSQGVRPAGTVSVQHLHCGMGYYRDQTGRCRRSRRPPSSLTRKHHHHHHHGTRKHKPTVATKTAAIKTAAPSPGPVPEPARDAVKEVANKNSVNKEPTAADSAVKDSPKDASKDSVGKEPVKEPVKDTPAAPVAVKETVKKDASPPVPSSIKSAAPKDPVKAHPVKQVPVKETVKTVSAKTPVIVQDRIATSAIKTNKDQRPAVKPPSGPVREAVAKPIAVTVAVHHQPQPQQLRQQQRQPVKAPSPANQKEAPKVSHHHGQHKITVIKEDTKPRAPPAAPAQAQAKIPASAKKN